MNKKLLLPILFGVVAAALNWYSLHTSMFPPGLEVVRASRALKAGEVIRDGDLGTVELTGDLGSIRQAVVPSEQKTVLIGRTVPRDLAEGDLFLWRDATPGPTALTAAANEKILPISLSGISIEPRLLEVGRQIGFLIAPSPSPLSGSRPEPAGRAIPAASRVSVSAPEADYVGPFTLLSVGARLAAEPSVSGRSDAGDQRLITIAVQLDSSGRLRDPAKRLVQALNTAVGESRRIVAILLDPSAHTPDAAPSTDPSAPVRSAQSVDPRIR